MSLRLVQKPTDGVCNASRCKRTEELETFEGGTELCPRHAGEYKQAGATESGLAAQGGGTEPAEPSTVQVLTLLTPIKVKAEQYTEALKNYTITNQLQLDKIGAILVDVKTDAKAVETERKKIVRPFIDAKTKLDGVFKPTAAACAKAEALLKAMVSKYMADQEDHKVAALDAGDHTAALALPETTAPTGVSVRYLWRCEVTNPEEVPREFLMVDAAALQIVADRDKASAKVPGVRFFAIQSTAVST